MATIVTDRTELTALLCDNVIVRIDCVGDHAASLFMSGEETLRCRGGVICERRQLRWTCNPSPPPGLAAEGHTETAIFCVPPKM